MSEIMNRDEVVALLREGTHTVTFTKQNGSKRVMRASLEPSVITEVYGSRTFSDNDYDQNQVRCIDVDKQEWRSFCLDSVIDFQ